MNQAGGLSQKQAALIEALHKGASSSQRVLSATLGVSLGQVNSLINEMINSGDIAVVRNNGRSVKYVVTNNGSIRWMRYTRGKLSEAFKCISDVKRLVGTILDRLFEQGTRVFVLDGENDTMAAIVSEVFREAIGNKGKLLWGPVKDDNHIVLKLDDITSSSNERVVNLLQEVASRF